MQGLEYPGNSSISGELIKVDKYHAKIMEGFGQTLSDPSRPGGVLVAVDELQKITHGLEELTISLRSRLSPVLRDNNQTRMDPNPSAPEPPRAPLEYQLRLIGRELQEILANIDYILKYLEL